MPPLTPSVFERRASILASRRSAGNLRGHDDTRIWHEAQRAERFLITEDLDFSDARRFAPGIHYGLMLVRLRVPGRLALTRRVQQIFADESVEEWQRCFVLVTDIKLRVHKD